MVLVSNQYVVEFIMYGVRGPSLCYDPGSENPCTNFVQFFISSVSFLIVRHPLHLL